MGKINRKAVNAKKNKDQPGKAKGSASAAAGSEKAKKSKESGGGVVLLGVKKKSATVKSAKLRKKDRVRVKKQHLLLKLQGGNSLDKVLQFRGKNLKNRLWVFFITPKCDFEVVNNVEIAWFFSQSL